MDAETHELQTFCAVVETTVGDVLAAKGYSMIKAEVDLPARRSECEYQSDRANLRVYYYRPDGEVNCVIRDRSEGATADWQYITVYLNYGRDWTDEEWAENTETDGSIKEGLLFYRSLIEKLK